MPWKVSPMSELRLAFVHQVRSLGRTVAAACRDFGISRKTGHKWLTRYHTAPADPLADRSTRPRRSPGRTPPALEQRVLELRRQSGWGPRKLHALLRGEHPDLPSARTLANVLKRHGCIPAGPPAVTADQRFERARPNELWQCDFKGYCEIQGRRVYPFTLLDDHSRFLLAARPGLDQTMATAWAALWDAFGAYGLPEELLCDRGFGDHNPRVRTLSWFEARLLRLGIRPCHGRPDHPQTQGKLERLHGTLEREAYPHLRRDDLDHFRADLDAWRTGIDNAIRPHEALGDRPPLTRWRPSLRDRPPALPEPAYPADATLRRVSGGGDISWRGYRFLVGGGLAGDRVRVEERDAEVWLSYAAYTFRRVPLTALVKGPTL
jgi:transposase InsO family protein